MVTIVKNSKLMIKNGGRKFSTQLIRRPYLKNELFDSSLIIHTILYLKAILFSESGRIFDKSSFEVKEISKGLASFMFSSGFFGNNNITITADGRCSRSLRTNGYRSMQST